MTTLRQLKKEAESLKFIDFMKTMGFSCGPDNFWFYRWRGQYLDIIDFWLKPSGRYVDAVFLCSNRLVLDSGQNWKPDLEKFPEGGFLDNIALYSDKHILDEEDTHILWQIANEVEIQETFLRWKTIIPTTVNKWFNNIDSDEKLYYQGFSIREQETAFGQEMKKLLVKNSINQS